VAASSRDWNAAARARTSAGSNRSPCSRRIWNRLDYLPKGAVCSLSSEARV
jgi:hypothetical protein